MRVQQEKTGREFALDDPPLAHGGEATIYALPGRPDLVAKVYHRPTPEHAAKLGAMLAAPPAAGTGAAGHLAHLTVAWPVDRLLAPDGGRVVGYLMPRVEGARRVCEVYNPQARRRGCPSFHYGYLLRTARNLAAAVGALHRRGYVIGDLNESNVLVTPQALVTLVDADSFQVPGPGRVYRCRVGKPEFTPPELQGAPFADVDRGPEHDAFALGVLVFQLLMQGLHPFAGMFTGEGEPDPLPVRIAAGFWPYAWERPGPFQPIPYAPPWAVLPPPVQELFFACFEEGHACPERRPGAAAWQQALGEAEALLTVCPVNTHHHFPRGLDVCPWCALARQQDFDPFPSPAELSAAGPAAPAHLPGTGAAPARRRAEPRPLSGFDPNDPLPPPPAEDQPTPAPAVTGAVTEGLQQLGAAVERRPWLVWAATGAVGAVLGVLLVAWQYRPVTPQPPGAPRESARKAPLRRQIVRLTPAPPPTVTPEPGPAAGQGRERPPAPPPVPTRLPSAPPAPPDTPAGPSPEEEAWRLAARDLEEARRHFRESTRSYDEAVTRYREGRVPLQTLLEQARALRAEASGVQAKANLEKEKWLLWQEAQKRAAAASPP